MKGTFCVHQLREEDIYQNIVKLHPGMFHKIKENHTYSIRNGNKKVYAWLRSNDQNKRKIQDNAILLDYDLRTKLGIDRNQQVTLKFEKCNSIFLYATHSNPIIKIAFWTSIALTVISLFTSLLFGLFL